MASEPLKSRELPTAVWHVVERNEHFNKMIPRTKEIGGIVEDAMPQSSPYEHSKEDVQEEWIELLVRDALLPVESVHEQRSKQKTHNPTSGIPPERNESEVSDDGIWIPKNKRKCIHKAIH